MIKLLALMILVECLSSNADTSLGMIFMNYV
jgi:hypothetical protein